MLLLEIDLVAQPLLNQLFAIQEQLTPPNRAAQTEDK
jgi:hypothetical protein